MRWSSRWRLGKNRPIGGSLLASAAVQLLLVVSGVLVARALGPEDRGNLALLLVVSGVTFLLVGLGLPSATTYFIARDETHTRAIAESLSRPGLVQVVAGFLLQVVVISFLALDTPSQVQIAAVVSLFQVPAYLAFAYGLAIVQGQRRFRAYNVLRTLPTVLYVGGVVVLFLANDADLVPIMLAWTVANLVGGVATLGVAIVGLPPARTHGVPPRRRAMATYGLKSLLGSTSPVDQFRLDQAIVGLFMTPVALGLYVVAQAFTILPRLAAASVGLVALPQVAAEPDPAAARRAMWRFFAVGVALAALVAVPLEVLAGQLVTLFFGDAFGEATSIARILIIASLFVAARRVLTDGLSGLGHPGLGTLAEVFSWIAFAVALAILAPRSGVEGVALSLAVAWGGSLLLLLGLAAVVATHAGASARRFWTSVRRSFPARAPVDRVQSRRAGPIHGDAARHGHLGPMSEPVRHLGRHVGSRQLRHLLVPAVALAAILVGTGVGLLPTLGVVVAVVVISAILFVVFARHRVGQVTRSFGGVESTGSPELVDDERAVITDQFRAARVFFYAGLLLLALLSVRVVGQVTVSDAFFLLSFLIAGAELAIARRPIPIRLPVLLLLGMGIFAFGGVLSSFQSYDALRSVAVIVRLIALTVFWFWLGTLVLRRREHVLRAVALWVAGVAICGGAAVVQVVAGDVVPTANFEGTRATGFSWQPNDLGGIASVAFVPAMMLATRPGQRVDRRLLSYGAVALVVAGLILSGSVGSFLAAVAATFVWFALHRTSVRSLLLVGALVLTTAGVTAVQEMRGASTPLDRLTQVSTSREEGGTGSVSARIATYRIVSQRIEENPFVGVGLDLESATKPFPLFSYEYDVHNVVIATWYKAGLFGLVGMLTVFLAVFVVGWRAVVGSTSHEEASLAIALLCGLVAFSVLAMGSPILYVRYGWVCAALVLALRAVQMDARVPLQWRRGDRLAIEPSPA